MGIHSGMIRSLLMYDILAKLLYSVIHGLHISMSKILSNVILYFRSPSSPSLTTVTINTRSNSNNEIQNNESLVSDKSLPSVGVENVTPRFSLLPVENVELNNKTLNSDSDDFIIGGRNLPSEDDYENSYYEDYYEAYYDEETEQLRKRVVKRLTEADIRPR